MAGIWNLKTKERFKIMKLRKRVTTLLLCSVILTLIVYPNEVSELNCISNLKDTSYTILTELAENESNYIGGYKSITPQDKFINKETKELKTNSEDANLVETTTSPFVNEIVYEEFYPEYIINFEFEDGNFSTENHLPYEQASETPSVEDDFIQNVKIEFEQGNGNRPSKTENVSILTTDDIDDTVYSTAPVTAQTSTLKINSGVVTGIRYSVAVSHQQRVAATEYGFLIATTAALEAADAELTFDLENVKYVTGIAYNKENGTDNYADITEDGSYVVNFAMTGIPQSKHLAYVTARAYIKYVVDGVDTIVYGNTYTTSVYRTAKNTLTTSTDAIEIELAEAVIEQMDNQVEITTAESVTLESGITGSIESDPDVDVVKFSPVVTGCYMFTYEASNDTVFEILDSNGSIMREVAIGPTESAHVLENGQDYYLRVKGNPNNPYSAEAQLIYDDTIVWEFDSSAEGFYFDQDASNGGVVDSKLAVAINKTSDSANFNGMAYMGKSGLSIDLLNYSKAIVRLKNCTNTTDMQWYFKIDSDYDGVNGASWYQPEVIIPSNMTDYQYVEFDLSLRSGLLKSLMIGFGRGGEELVGNVFIDSIAFIPMPSVYGWEFDESNENWTINERISSSTIVDGAYMIEILGHDENTCTDPAIYSPSNNVGVSTEKYNKVQISIKNISDATEMELYFATYTDGQGGFSENRCVSINIEPNSSDFVEYTFDLVPEDCWYGILKKMMISVHGEGTACIDYIRFAKFDVDYPDIIWEFDDNTVQNFTVSDNNTGAYQHQIKAENGTLVVTRTSAGNGGIFTPDKLKLPTNEYRYLIFGVNSATADAEFKVYFDTTDSYYAENDDVNKVVNTRSVQIKKSNIYREYAIDLSAVDNGWTTNYQGNLNQLMFSLLSDGVFEFDYIKLSNDGTIDIPSENEISIYTKAGQTHSLIIMLNNVFVNSETIFTINYDEDVIILEDACAFTFEKELQTGDVEDAGITIVSTIPGRIQFKSTNSLDGVITGVINCMRFKGLANTTTSVTINRE